MSVKVLSHPGLSHLYTIREGLVHMKQLFLICYITSDVIFSVTFLICLSCYHVHYHPDVIHAE